MGIFGDRYLTPVVVRLQEEQREMDRMEKEAIREFENERKQLNRN